MHNHDHNVDPLRQQITDIVHEALGSPHTQNAVIGSVFKHVSVALNFASAQYMPVSDREFLVKPELLSDGSCTALLLIARDIHQPNCYHLMAQKIDGKLHLNWFRPHLLNLLQTEHTYPSPCLEEEARRQLSDPRFDQAFKAGPMLMTAIIAENYFGVTPAPAPAPELAPAPTTVSEAAPAEEDNVLAQLAMANREKATAPAPVSKLPAVNPEAGVQ